MNNKNLQREETEFPNADERKISELVGSLERVSAPNDFEFRLKARIAAGKGENYQTVGWQRLRYLLPVGASAFILAFVLYATNFFAPQPFEKAAETLSSKTEPTAVQTIETPANTMVAVSNANKAEIFPINVVDQKESPRIIDEEEEPRFISENPKKKALPNISMEDGSSSRDTTVTTPPVILPLNLNPEKKLDKPQEFDKSQAFTVLDILKNIGIEAVSENNKLKVKSILQNSPAGLSDVKDGDVIEAIDDLKIEGSGKSQNLKGAKKITVLRDGKLITIDLKLN